MRSIVFELKIVTPLFMGNATFASEIRTQSINGVIRHWFRLLGGDPEKEVKLFGNTFSKGNVFIRINSEKLTPINKQISVNNYVSFPIKKRSYIPTELNGLKSTNFTITFLFHPRLNEEEIKQFLCAFWCSLYLGNFGSRSTRGFGSLICTNQPNFESLVKNFCLSFEINEDTSQWYKQQIDYIKNINKWERVKNLPFVFEDLEIYLLSENFSNYEEAINRMSSLMQKYRKKYNPDYKYIRILF
ncbi:MAG: type III-B CRISPR module RAMP protein Cmr1, partial [Candidatus Calescibacterium sp.]|nr:type III-B CRISPR module RAMP protein Cmr1 [Candidatus Calescibacterium sp.]MDW8133288.1 type III-B CRISPR module RAMP protein Cmr1 [Candidatus Calescibacterium sp.]